MKRAVILLVLTALLAFPGRAMASVPDIAFLVGDTVYYDWGYNCTMDVAPFIDKGRVYVPVRYLAYALGIRERNILWDAPSQTVSLTKEGYGTISLKIGNKVMRKTAGQPPVHMDTAPLIMDGRVFLPARYVAEAFGASVVWDRWDQMVIIYCENAGQDGRDIARTVNSKFITPSYDLLTFDWEYDERPQHLETKITGEFAREYLDKVRKKEHPSWVEKHLLTYCTDEEEKKFVKTLVDDLKKNLPEVADQRDYVDYVIAFVQGVKYADDASTTGFEDYWRYPSETVLEKTGDCEDSAILAAVMIRELGYGVALIAFDGHVGVGIKGADFLPGCYYEKDGVKYYYLETTASGWNVGDLPEDEAESMPVVLPLP